MSNVFVSPILTFIRYNEFCYLNIRQRILFTRGIAEGKTGVETIFARNHPRGKTSARLWWARGTSEQGTEINERRSSVLEAVETHERDIGLSFPQFILPITNTFIRVC